MDSFKKIYESLNTQQQRAVNLIDGPLLVLAGPGTGKTQLLSARVANILTKTDTLPQNILCLTFTESGARAMRERLSGMIGPGAYDVHISTYHSFGSDIIKSYPQYFTKVSLNTDEDTRLEKPIDDLAKTQIVERIILSLGYDDPLRSARYFIKSVVSTISELKKSLVTHEQLAVLATKNIADVTAISPALNDAWGNTARVPKIADAITLFSSLLNVLSESVGSLGSLAANDLKSALQLAEESGKTTSLTAWKKQWLTKTETGQWQLAGLDASEKMLSLAHVYATYQQVLAKKSLYDFDDMILRVIEALNDHKDLLYSLQETYQYILLDEFQDTNAAQFKLVQLLADNPVHEGRPNVMAVGDDDQAIYAFQGAEIGNMHDFTTLFSDVPIINLTQNYRSHHDIIHTAHAVAQQIESRLHYNLQGVSKTLEAASTSLPQNAVIERHEFAAEASEYAWVAEKIASLLASGVSPSQIAVLSPKHKKLEAFVPFANNVNVAVAYEKRENILDTEVVRSLELMTQLCLGIQSQSAPLYSQLFAEVLSLPFWNVPTAAIWQTNWQAAKKSEERSWPEIALDNDDLRAPVLFFLQLGTVAANTPLEYMLDYLTGVSAVKINPDELFTSPFKDYYASKQARQTDQLAWYEAVSHLSVIRSKLRDYQSSEEDMLTLQNFVDFIAMYRVAEQPLINSHPLAQSANAVELMTVYKAKGLEFEHVFLLSVHDDIWGKAARQNSNKVGLPANLSTIRYRGSSEDELRRVLFVAITRAKYGLYLTSHAYKDTGKATEPVKYLLELKEGEQRVSAALPKHSQTVYQSTQTALKPAMAIELFWQQRHTSLTPELTGLLAEKLTNYIMSPTHLNTYIDTEYGGPEAFLLRTLLKFPQAPTPDGEFGNAVHATLDWYQKLVTKNNTPTLQQVLAQFDHELLGRYISNDERDNYRSRGHKALALYIPARQSMFKESALSEVDFVRENVLINDTAHITGKLDRVEVNDAAKTIHIVDFKTGQPATKWERELKYLKYRQQLYFYKLLIEGSRTYKKYKVLTGRLEFIEPNKQGSVADPLVITYDEDEAAELRKLILAVWQHIQNLQLDTTASYSADYKGSSAFISALISDQ